MMQVRTVVIVVESSTVGSPTIIMLATRKNLWTYQPSKGTCLTRRLYSTCPRSYIWHCFLSHWLYQIFMMAESNSKPGIVNKFCIWQTYPLLQTEGCTLNCVLCPKLCTTWLPTKYCCTYKVTRSYTSTPLTLYHPFARTNCFFF